MTTELSALSKDKVKDASSQLRDITIGCKKEESCYKSFIEDTGIGIHKNQQDKIFKLFNRLKDVETAGTGIGLAIVKEIVVQYKGNIWIESPVYNGRDSRFRFAIPSLKKEIYTEVS